jgi:hypothetical protein
MQFIAAPKKVLANAALPAGPNTFAAAPVGTNYAIVTIYTGELQFRADSVAPSGTDGHRYGPGTYPLAFYQKEFVKMKTSGTFTGWITYYQVG